VLIEIGFEGTPPARLAGVVFVLSVREFSPRSFSPTTLAVDTDRMLAAEVATVGFDLPISLLINGCACTLVVLTSVLATDLTGGARPRKE
jgi:hypothetical protein